MTGPPLGPAAGSEPAAEGAAAGNPPADSGREEAVVEGGWHPLLPLVAPLALIGLFAWYLWRRRHPAAAGGPPPPASPGRALRRLRRACRDGDPQAAREALIEWGRARWPDLAPVSLEAIARRLGSPAGREIRRLQKVLYAGAGTRWEGRKLLEAVVQAEEERPATAPPADALPPLYRL